MERREEKRTEQKRKEEKKKKKEKEKEKRRNNTTENKTRQDKRRRTGNVTNAPLPLARVVSVPHIVLHDKDVSRSERPRKRDIPVQHTADSIVSDAYEGIDTPFPGYSLFVLGQALGKASADHGSGEASQEVAKHLR